MKEIKPIAIMDLNIQEAGKISLYKPASGFFKLQSFTQTYLMIQRMLPTSLGGFYRSMRF